jgi:hypothetical protein
MEELNTPEYQQLRGYIRAMGDCILGANYVTSFWVRGYDLAECTLLPEEMMKIAFPESHPEPDKFKSESAKEMVSFVSRCIKYPERMFASQVLRELIEKNLTAGYLKHLKACVDYEQSEVFYYSPDYLVENLAFMYPIYWGYTYMIVNREQRRCIIIHAAAGD